MAIEIADLTTLYSAQTTVDVRENAVWPMLTNRMWEGELTSAYKVVIQDPTYNTKPKARTRGADFQASDEVSSDQIELIVTNEVEQNTRFDYEDIPEAPIEWLARTRMSQALSLMTEDGDTAAGDSINTSLYRAMTGSTFANAQKRTFGTDATDFISRNASNNYAGTGRGYGLLTDAITAVDIYIQRANQRGSTIGGSVGEPVVVMAPELFAGYRQYLLEQKYYFEAVNSAIFSNGSILSGERFMGKIFGINFMTSNRYSVPTGNGDWKLHMFTPNCFAFAMKPPYVQILAPGVNQNGPHWRLIQINRWAIKEINDAFKFEITVKAD